MGVSASDLKVIATYNNTKRFPTIEDVATELGCTVKTVRNRIGELRRKALTNHEIPHILARTPALLKKVPMSESSTKAKDVDAEQCIEELLRIANLDTTKIVSRNYFRVHSTIAESAWSQHFGTFEEFKRQAGIKLTRQQHGLERAIAKHASVDHYRILSAERLDYADKYKRENPRRFKTLIAASDLHDIEIDPFFLRVFLDTCKRVQPDVVSLVGDIFDLPEFGRWTVDPRDWDVTGRIKFAHDSILSPLRQTCPEAQIDMIEGNHEARLLRHLADATPALRAVLSDLHGFTVGKLFGLDKFEVNYVAQSDLAAWSKRDQEREVAKNYKVYWGSVMCHHFPHARNMGLPGVNGHHHAHQVWPMFNPVYGAYEWHQMGAGHHRSASYAEGEKWHNGFAIINVDTYTKTVNIDYVPVSDFAVSGGKWYYRSEKEGDVGQNRICLA